MDGASLRSTSVLAIVVAYATFAALWILLSDRLLGWLLTDPATITLVSTLKGWLFVVVTSVLLYLLMRRFLGESRWRNPHPSLYKLPFVMLAVAIMVITGLGISNALIHQRDETHAQLQAIASMKERQITDWLQERQGDAAFVQTSRVFADQFERGYVQHDGEALKALQTRLEQLRAARNFHAISLVAPEGHLVWSSDQNNIVSLPEVAQGLRRAEASGQSQRIGPFLDSRDQPQLIWIVPLSSNGSQRPVIILQVSPSLWLYPTLQLWPDGSAGAETLLLRREGNRAVILNASRLDAAKPGHQALPLEQENGLLQHWAPSALREGATPALSAAVLLKGKDQRDIHVQAVVRAIPGSNWALLVKQDTSAMYGSAVADASWIGLAGVLGLLMATGGFLLMRQHHDLVLAAQVRQSQAERLRSLNLLHAIAESSTDAIFAKDTEGRYLVVNGRTARLMGQPADKIIGRRDDELLPTAVVHELMQRDQRVLRDNQVETQQEVLNLPDGRKVFFTTKGPLHDDQGKVIGLFGIARDITERQQTAEALQASEARYRQLLDSASDAVFVATADGRLQYANPQAAQLMACPRGDLLSRNLSQLSPPSDAEQFSKLLQEIKPKQSLRTDWRLYLENSTAVPVEINAVRLPDNSLFLTCRDVRERRHAETLLMHQTEELRARNAELERFNRASVGRELAMVELKQQINLLCRELRKPEPYPLQFMAMDKTAWAENAESSTLPTNDLHAAAPDPIQDEGIGP